MVKKVSGIILSLIFMVLFVITSMSTVYAKTTLKITKQPTSVSVSSGSVAKATIKAKGDGLKYKWYFKDTGSKKYKVTTSFKKNYYSVKMNKKRDGRQVYCVITDKYGNSKKTKTVTLSLKTALKITKQPSSVYALNGKEAKVSFKVQGDGLTYKWYYKNQGDKKFKSTTAFKSNSYKITMSKKSSGRQVYCVITDKYGSSVKTKTVTLSLKTPLKITKQPVSVYALDGKEAKVSFKVQGDGLKYKWYYKNKGDKKFSSTSAFTGNSYSAVMNKTRSGRQIYCVISDKYGNSVKTNTVTLSLKTPLKITKQPVSVYALDGKDAKVSFKVQGDGLKYKWYYKNEGDKKFSSTSAFKGNSYSAVMNKTRSGRQIYCVISDKYGNSVKTNTVTLSLKTPLKITKQPVSVYALDGKDAKVSFKVQGDGLKYKWYYKNEGDKKFSSTSSFKGNSYNITMSESRSGRQVYCVITDKYGSSVKTNTVTLSLKTALKITKQPVSVYALDGKDAKVSFKVQGDGLTYKWYFKNKGDSKFSSTSSFKDNSYSITMSKSRSGRQVYCVVTDKYGDKVNTDTVTLSLKTPLEITEQPSSVVAPDGTEVKISFTAKGDGLKYKWYYMDAGSSEFTLTNSFKGNSYTVSVNKSRSGRQLYCEVTDKYGDSVKTNTVTINMGTPLEITRQPFSVATPKGTDVNITFEAQGEGLTYKWYYKDKDGSKFSSTSSFTSNYYSLTMSSSRSGRQVYCLVTDKFGNSVKTDVVTMKAGNSVFITIQPSSVTVAEGENAVVLIGAAGNGITYNWYVKSPGKSVFTLAPEFKAGSYSVKMSDVADGSEVYCIVTDKDGFSAKSDTATLSMTPAYVITADLGYGDPLTVNVKKDGKYSISKPIRPGYTFKGWQTLAGVSFAASGTVDRDISVKAVWEIQKTYSLSKLIERANSGATEILIAKNITIDQPIYISHDVTIYSDGNYTLKRDPNYGGDLFVVGIDSDGVSALMHHRKAVLTLGGGAGTLTIDGNRNKVKVNVVGSAIFAGYSSTVNIYDGVRICNNLKLGNERLLTYGNGMSEFACERAGGGAILNANAVINMYGGLIDNNGVKTEHTVVTDEQGVETKTEKDGCGGAIYNYGDFHMYGGTISNNQALRGGGIYTERALTLVSGTIQGNKSFTYGGALSTSATMYANVYIGDEKPGKTMLFKDNVSVSAGGAIYSNTSSPIIILGNASFEGNATDFSGGAIYTGGSLTVRNATFRNNSSYYNGGAVYFHNTKDSEWTPRRADITNCVFENNSASLGGAIIFSRSNKQDPKAKGITATVENCKFIQNKAVKNDTNPGNGGAMYITQMANVTVKGCEFTENSANSTGGAVSVHTDVNLKLSGSKFLKNTATNGGAMYLSVSSTSKLSDLTFDGNKAVITETGSGGNGGAVYAYKAGVTVSELDIRNNTADQHGGAIYLSATTLVMGADSTIEGNSAGNHGGAFYLTYFKNEDESRDVSKLTLNGIELRNNTAKSGGAISLRSGCEADIKNAKLIENKATGTQEELMGGGAVYAGFAKLTLTDVTMDKNSSVYYGGSLFSQGSDITITGGSVTGSVGGTGAALCFRDNTTAKLSNVTLSGNTASSNGVIYQNGSTLDMTNVTADGNIARSGGVLFTSGASTVININSCNWSENTATNGGAISVTNATLNIKESSFENNTASYGGVIYSDRGKLTTQNTAFSKNNAVLTAAEKGGNGGAVFLSGGTYTVSESDTFTGNTAAGHAGAIYVSYYTDETDGSKNGAVLTVPAADFIGNTALAGGAVSIRTNGVATFTGTTFTGNSATSDQTNEGGGAVYVGYGTLTLDGTVMKENSTSFYGGGVSAVGAVVDVKNKAVFENNSGATGLAIQIRENSTVTLNDVELKDNVANASANGTVYITGTGSLDMTKVSASGNKNANGAVVYASGTANVTVTDSVFNKNTATGSGGVIAYNAAGKLNVSKVELTENTAKHGGAISTNNENAEITLADCTITDNSAVQGGAVYIENATVSVTGGTMSKNTANLGGAIHNNLGALTLSGVTFTENSAEKTDAGDYGNGGAISLSGGSVNGTATFSDNTAGNHAGALYLSYAKLEDNTRAASTANITGSEFSGNTAMGGGAVSIRSDCSGTFENVTFTGNSVSGHDDDGDETTVDNNGNGNGEGGGAVYVGYGSVTLNNVTATGNSSTDSFGGFLDSVKSVVTVNGGTFTGNTAPAGGVFYGIENSEITITDALISENESTYENTDYDSSKGGGAVAVAGGKLTISGTTLSGNIADYYGGAVLTNGATVEINDTTVSGSSAGTGAALCFRSASKVTVADSSVIDNNSSSFGVVYQNGGTLDMTNVTANGNTGVNGGVLFTSGSSTVVTINNCTWTKNSAVSGGAINLDNASVTLNKCTVKENTAQLGGAVYNKTGTLNSDGSVFSDNTAVKNESGSNGNGGAVMLSGGTMNGLNETSLTGNSAENHGGAVYVSYFTNDDESKTGGVLNMTGGLFESNTSFAGGAISSRTDGTVNLNGTVLKNNKATSPYSGSAGGGAIYSNKNTLNLSGVTLDGNSTAYYGGAVYATDVDVQIKDNSQIKNTKGVTGSALYFVGSSNVLIDTVTLADNTASSNGVIYINSGSLEMKDLSVSGNKSNNGGVLYASGTAEVTVSGGSYTGNTANNGGGIFDWRSSGGLYVTDATFSGNTAKDGGVINAAQTAEFTECNFTGNSATNGGVVYATQKVTLSGCDITDNTATEKGGAIFAIGNTAEVTVKDGSVLSNNTAVNGGAVYMEQDAVVNIDNSTLTLNKATDGGAVYVAGTQAEAISTTLNLNNAVMTDNTATALGGAVYMESNGASALNGTFESNSSILGGAIFNRLGELTTTGVTFKENTAVLDSNEKNGNGGAVVVNGGVYTSSEKDTFTDNSAQGHAGAVYVTYVTNEGSENTPGIFNAGASSFNNNTAVAGGAVSVRSGCEMHATGTVFTGNSASSAEKSAGGGAVYAGWGAITLDGCTFDGNSTGFYGGAVSAPGSDVSITNGTEFKNNTGSTGTAVHLRDGGTATLNNVKLTDNIGTDGNGTVYITGNGTLNMTDVTATGNSNTNGGVIYASDTAKVNVAGGNYYENTALANGGVFDIRTSGAVKISGGTYSNNTASKGGMLYAYGASVNVTIDNAAQINSNTATTGGAVFMDLGATVTIKDSTLDGNSSAKDGGAIHVADTGTDTAAATRLNMSNTLLQNNSSSARGGALATDGSSTALIINVSGCTFYKNSSTTSGGAVSVQNGNCNSETEPTAVPIVFTNCTFRENASSTDGGALDVRSGSCMKIDGITAEGNTAAGNGGVVYVTSNNTRLYLTGEITYSNNTVGEKKDGIFSYLYNNSYLNAPKIYTTHSNTAAWYADVKGNRTNVVFNLPTLP